MITEQPVTYHHGETMNADQRLKLLIGSLVIQTEMQAAQIEELTTRIKELAPEEPKKAHLSEVK